MKTKVLCHENKSFIRYKNLFNRPKNIYTLSPCPISYCAEVTTDADHLTPVRNHFQIKKCK